MKLASYNVENLFQRAVALNQDTWDEGKSILADAAKLNEVLGKAKYSASDKNTIVALLGKLGLAKRDEGTYVILRQNRGHLLKRPKAGGIEIVAEGRADWIGWLELKDEEVNEVATRMTARVITEMNADVLAVVEAESRPGLVRFSKHLLQAAGGTPYDHIMLIDGNDDRGIDVGIMTRSGYPIAWIESHVDDADEHGVIFSRDCAIYTITTPKKHTLTILVNHFKSKGYGSQKANDAKRLRQTGRVKEIYEALVADGSKYVAVVGDFNENPEGPSLAPLLSDTDLKDISEHDAFDDGASGERPGTFSNGTATNKIDFILLSPALFARAKSGGIFRKGVWGGKNGTLFEHFDEITKASEAASDHAAIWAEIDV